MKSKDEFVLTNEGTVNAFLGYDVTPTKLSEGPTNSSIKGFDITQSGVIARIVKECGLEDSSTMHDTPAVT